MLALEAIPRWTCLQIKAGWPTHPARRSSSPLCMVSHKRDPPKRDGKLRLSPCRTEFLSANDAAILLQSLGLEVMRDLPPDHGNISELDECDADVDGFSSSDTASTCSNYYSSE